MGKQTNRKLIAYLPLVLVATFLVVVAPLLLVFWLRKSGVVTSVWAGMLAGVVVSFVASYASAAFWKTRTDSRDILFSELMIWGWVLRWRSERRLSAAADLLGLTTGRPKAISGGSLTNEQKTGLLTQLTSALEARDPYTHGHSRRVARHASNIAKRMGMAREDVAKIRAAGAMHDVGKVETPIAVLHKEGKLTDEEYAIVKRHPVDGATMVATLHDDELTAFVRHHHERLDGTGYPDRLAGEAIPIGARIIAVADTFDAITSTRPYRHASAHKKALDVLVAEAGTQLDPDAVRAFCACYSGRRPLAYWTILAHGRPRLVSWLGGGLSSAKAAAANVMATAGAAAAVGTGVVGPLIEAPPDSRQRLAEVGASPASSKSGAGLRASRWGSPPSPQARGDRRGTNRDHGSGPTRGGTRMPTPAPGPDQGSSADPGAPHVQAGGPGPGAGSIPGAGDGNGENQSSGQVNANGQGNGNGNGNGNGQGNGPGKGNGPGQNQGNGPGKGNGQGTGPGKGNGQNQGNGPGQNQGNGNGQANGPGQNQGNGNGNGNGNDTGGTPTPGGTPGPGNEGAPGGPSAPGGPDNGNAPGGPSAPGGPDNGNAPGGPSIPGGLGNGNAPGGPSAPGGLGNGNAPGGPSGPGGLGNGNAPGGPSGLGGSNSGGGPASPRVRSR